MIKFVYNIIIILLLINCAREKPQIIDPYLNDTLVKLNNYENDINKIYEKSKSFHDNILAKKQNLDNKLNSLFYIALNFHNDISQEASANYHEVKDLLHDVIKLNNDEDWHKQADILLANHQL